MSIEHLDWNAMSTKERAEYLLKIGVTAKLDMDKENLEPGFVAAVDGVGHLPCGYHKTEQAAIDAGTAWLREKAQAA